jgi:hypothetical protein
LRRDLVCLCSANGNDGIDPRYLSDAVLATGALLKAVADGDLTPTEAAELTRMVQAFAKIIETAQFEERIRKLEEATHK